MLDPPLMTAAFAAAGSGGSGAQGSPSSAQDRGSLTRSNSGSRPGSSSNTVGAPLGSRPLSGLGPKAPLRPPSASDGTGAGAGGLSGRAGVMDEVQSAVDADLAVLEVALQSLIANNFKGG